MSEKESFLETIAVRQPTAKDQIMEILNVAAVPIIGMLFHPVYTIVNASACGHLGPSELAGFGLGNLTLGILTISIGTCFSLSTGSLIAKAAGKKDYRMCRVYLNRQYYLNTLIFTAVSIPLLFIKHIYAGIGQDAVSADFAVQYVWIVLPGIYCHF